MYKIEAFRSSFNMSHLTISSQFLTFKDNIFLNFAKLTNINSNKSTL